MERTRLRLANVLEAHGQEFLAAYGQRLSAAAHRAVRAVRACRTAALGGHARRCGVCGHVEVHYRSCGNRHCPGCGAGKRAAWLEREAKLLLAVPYHHVVFTLPSALHPLTRQQPRWVYQQLFAAASATVQEVAANPKHLGAQLGLLLVLHTWGQDLHLHPHVHGLATGGGLACDAAGRLTSPPRWQACRRGFFLPVRVLSRVFRGKFVAGLRAAALAGRLPGLADPEALAALVAKLQAHDWVVYAQPPAAGPEVVLKYLARYVSRVAFSESRLLRLDEGRVTFTRKDYKAGGVVKEMTLPAVEFLRRWTEHVLPRGFVAARHYGLLANRGRQAKLALCRRLLLPLLYVVSTVAAAVLETPACPQCGAQVWELAGAVPPERAAAVPRAALVVAGWDSS
jgi:hypothetical protein